MVWYCYCGEPLEKPEAQHLCLAQVQPCSVCGDRNVDANGCVTCAKRRRHAAAVGLAQTPPSIVAKAKAHRYAIALALADGFAALCGPRCARCEKGLRPAEADHAALGNHWCDDCWSHVHETGEDEWYPEGATTGNDKPRLLPRPGAIVLAVDDPCGDDVAEG